MSSVANLFNAVNKSVLSACSYRVGKIEGLYLEMIALFQAIQLLDPIEERVKQIENQTRNIRFNFEHDSTAAIAECNRDIFKIEKGMEETKRGILDLEKYKLEAGIKDMEYDEIIKKLEEETTSHDGTIKKLEEELKEKIKTIEDKQTEYDEKIKKLDERTGAFQEELVAHKRDVNEKVNSMNTSLAVLYGEIGDLDEKVKRFEQRVITLESKPCQIPEAIIRSLEYSMDQKIKKNNEDLDNIITNTITTAIQDTLQDKDSTIFKQIVLAVKEGLG
jgi:chromosome segregation ATPase